MFKRIGTSAFILLAIGAPLIFIFTGKIFNSIIFLLGGVIALLGFAVMVKMTDIVLKTGMKKERRTFFLIGFVKLAIIGAVFYPISRVSEVAVFFFVGGMLIIFPAIIAGAVYQLRRGTANGGA